jgi:hypothetical protein
MPQDYRARILFWMSPSDRVPAESSIGIDRDKADVAAYKW